MTEANLEKAVHLEDSVVKVHESYAVLYGWVRRLQNLQMSLQSKLELIRSTEATRRRLVENTETGNVTDDET